MRPVYPAAALDGNGIGAGRRGGHWVYWGQYGMALGRRFALQCPAADSGFYGGTTADGIRCGKEISDAFIPYAS